MPNNAFAAALLGVLLAAPLAGCAAPTASPVTPSVGTITVARPDDEASCRTAGGQWAKGGRRGLELCFLPLSDAGKSCARDGDCEGSCLVTEAGAQCQKVTPIFGCYSFLDEAGRKETICRD